MKFATMGTLALTLTALWGTDAHALGRRNKAKACCPANSCQTAYRGASSGCVTGGCGAMSGYAYASGQHMVSGYAVAPLAVQPMPTTAPTDSTPGATAGVVPASGTTANASAGVVPAAGTTVMAMPATNVPSGVVSPISWSNGTGCDDCNRAVAYDATPNRRRGLFGFRR